MSIFLFQFTNNFVDLSAILFVYSASVLSYSQYYLKIPNNGNITPFSFVCFLALRKKSLGRILPHIYAFMHIVVCFSCFPIEHFAILVLLLSSHTSSFMLSITVIKCDILCRHSTLYITWLHLIHDEQHVSVTLPLHVHVKQDDGEVYKGAVRPVMFVCIFAKASISSFSPVTLLNFLLNILVQ